MYASKNLTPKFIFRFAWKPLLIFTVYAILLTCLYQFAKLTIIALPFIPIGLMGTAVAFYVGFKNNSSYERLWEARRIWGLIVNLSRSFTVYVLDYLQPTDNVNEASLADHKQIIIHRHIGYINTLRIQLRYSRVWDVKADTFRSVVDEEISFNKVLLLDEIKRFLHSDEAVYLDKKSNTAAHLLRKQSQHLTYLAEQGCLTEFKHVEMGRMVSQLYDQQGACERLKTYPYPRQYAHFSELFVWLLALVLPFGLIGELSKFGYSYVWMAIPMSVLISWVFHVMETIGDSSENPFENSVNDVPITAICRNIEIDLREMLDEKDIPPHILPVNNILM